MRTNQPTDKRVTQYNSLYYCVFRPTVLRNKKSIVVGGGWWKRQNARSWKGAPSNIVEGKLAAVKNRGTSSMMQLPRDVAAVPGREREERVRKRERERK